MAATRESEPAHRRRRRRCTGSLRRDHHRRQRPVGDAPGPAGARRTRGRRRRGQGAAARRRRPRHRGADRVLVLDRELDPPGRRGPGADGDDGRAESRPRRRSCTTRGCGCASSGAAATPCPRRLIERMAWAEELTRGQRPDHAVRGLQLRRQGGNRRCSANLHIRNRGRLPSPPVRTRHARSRPDHPHQRRAPDLELPALAGGVLGVGVPRRAVAGLLTRVVRSRASRSSPPAAAGSEAGSDAGRARAARQPGSADRRREPPEREAAANGSPRRQLGSARADPRRDPAGDRHDHLQQPRRAAVRAVHASPRA